jgi:hypothetical protein
VTLEAHRSNKVGRTASAETVARMWASQGGVPVTVVDVITGREHPYANLSLAAAALGVSIRTVRRWAASGGEHKVKAGAFIHVRVSLTPRS